MLIRPMKTKRMRNLRTCSQTEAGLTRPAQEARRIRTMPQTSMGQVEMVKAAIMRAREERISALGSQRDRREEVEAADRTTRADRIEA